MLIDEPLNRTEVLDVAVVQLGQVYEDDFVEIKFDWSVTNVTSTAVEIQLTFDDPLLVTSGVPIEHSVQVSINDTILFVSRTGKLIDPSD